MSHSVKMALRSAPETPPGPWPEYATWSLPGSEPKAGPTSPPGSAGHPATTPTHCHYYVSPRENAEPLPCPPATAGVTRRDECSQRHCPHRINTGHGTDLKTTEPSTTPAPVPRSQIIGLPADSLKDALRRRCAAGLRPTDM